MELYSRPEIPQEKKDDFSRNFCAESVRIVENCGNRVIMCKPAWNLHKMQCKPLRATAHIVVQSSVVKSALLLRMAFELQTARLKMRPITTDDIDELHALWTNADVRRYLWDDVVIDTDRAQTEINYSIASFYIYRFGLWAITLKGSSPIIGFCGLRRFGDPPQTELIYGLHPDHWHQGLATEAAQEVLRYGFEELEMEKIYAGRDLPNMASQAVIQRLGMSDAHPMQVRGREAEYCSISRASFSTNAR
jgi:RimJ/RimL family protein N-acetyltransferase